MYKRGKCGDTVLYGGEGEMRKKRFWLVALILGIMMVTTGLYITMVHNTKTTYANGKFVGTGILTFGESV